MVPDFFPFPICHLLVISGRKDGKGTISNLLPHYIENTTRRQNVQPLVATCHISGTISMI